MTVMRQSRAKKTRMSRTGPDEALLLPNGGEDKVGLLLGYVVELGHGTLPQSRDR